MYVRVAKLGELPTEQQVAEQMELLDEFAARQRTRRAAMEDMIKAQTGWVLVSLNSSKVSCEQLHLICFCRQTKNIL